MTAIPPPRRETPKHLTEILRDAFIGMVRSDTTDLSARGLAIFMVCGLDGAAHTVRGLAMRLAIPKPAVTRTLDRLEELQLLQRKPDPADRRSVLVSLTPAGRKLLASLRRIVGAAAAGAGTMPGNVGTGVRART